MAEVADAPSELRDAKRELPHLAVRPPDTDVDHRSQYLRQSEKLAASQIFARTSRGKGRGLALDGCGRHIPSHRDRPGYLVTLTLSFALRLRYFAS
jgi:hypothetical protein